MSRALAADLDLQAGAMHGDGRIADVGPAIEIWQLPESRQARDVAHDAEVEPSVVDFSSGSDVHAASVVRAVRDRHEQHPPLDRLAVENDPELAVLESAQLGQRRQQIPRASRLPAATRCHGGGHLGIEADATRRGKPAPASVPIGRVRNVDLTRDPADRNRPRLGRIGRQPEAASEVVSGADGHDAERPAERPIRRSR